MYRDYLLCLIKIVNELLLGAQVIMACRDLEKCAAAQKEIVDETHNHKVICKKLDLASFKSIKEFTADVQKGAILSHCSSPKDFLSLEFI